MPYTPPSHNSPATSRPESPDLSRSHSYSKSQNHPGPSSAGPPPPRPGLPRSTSSSSYLHKHRRSPSFSNTPLGSDASSEQASSNASNSGALASSAEDRANLDVHGSLRQSPPPANNALIPSGAMLSPPESSQNSSDDEESTRGRGRDLENLAELQAAIKIIQQHKEGSPNRQNEETKKAKRTLELVVPRLKSTIGLGVASGTTQSLRLPLSKEARKISHSRSSTDSGLILDLVHQAESPMRTSNEDSDQSESGEERAERPFKPQMVRKKSGELVRPALRPASAKRRPSSMPGTPTYGKAVHFDSHLEHVRHFLKVDKPLAVSAGSSPVENFENDPDFPFPDEAGRSRTHPYEWEIRLANFPSHIETRKQAPVSVERVFLSSDNKSLVGAVVVQNLAFNKHVTARFSLDYWKTTSEVVAGYNNDVRRNPVNDGCDRFSFSIKLADLANLENKTMFFCVRYNVNGQEFWDNNNSVNYQVDFSRKPKLQLGKNGTQSAASCQLNALPRSKPSSPSFAESRPKSMTLPSFDDFSAGIEFKTFDQSSLEVMGESPIKLKGPRARHEIVPDAPARRSNPASQAFGNRYDFAASLSNAIQAASTSLSDKSGLATRDNKPEAKSADREVVDRPNDAASSSAERGNTSGPEHGIPTLTSPTPAISTGPSKPAALVSEKPALSSTSYQELVDKYCFFGSSKSSPPQNKSMPGPMDGAGDDISVADVSHGSVESSGQATPINSSPPPVVRKESPTKSFHDSPRHTRSISPSPMRASSPVSFGYPYHQSMTNGFHPETRTPTAIRG